MSLLRCVALVALVLASAVVVVASPAFATPRLTTSTGASGGRPDNGAVSPFITPIGNTLRRSITVTNVYALGRGSSFVVRSLSGGSLVWTCVRLAGLAFPSITHTRLKVTSFSIGDCQFDLVGFSIVVTTGASSSTPYFIHLTGSPTASSTDGVFELPNGQGITFSIRNGGLTLCEITTIPQSLRLRLTDLNRQVQVLDPTIRFTLDSSFGGTVCPDPARTMGLTTATFVRYTEDEASRFRATALSSQ
jgi:hypothetical protein